MLKSLTIRNYALIESVEIEFESGLNILTGETGAGKSIIIDALSLILGERASSDVVRKGSEKAIVEGIFGMSDSEKVKALLRQNEIELQEDFILRREVSAKGQSRCFVNDSPVPLTILKEIGDHLVDLHGQHEHQSLLRPETHIGLLDEFGSLDKLASEYRESYDRLSLLFHEFRTLSHKEKELKEKRDLYEFQIKEIDAVDPRSGEESELENELRILENSEKLFEATSQLYQSLYEGDAARQGSDNTGSQSVYDLLLKARNQLEDLAEIDTTFEDVKNECASAAAIVGELTKFIQSYNSKIEFNPERLEQIRERLGQITLLKKKFGGSLETVIEHREKIGREFAMAENFENEIGKLNEQIELERTTCSAAAQRLSAKRRELVGRIGKSVCAELAKLGIANAQFDVKIDNRVLENKDGRANTAYVKLGREFYDASQNGIDVIEFYLSTNAGEDLKPLAKVASGGEISRIMLALKTILAKADRLPLLVFDEIDVGISGRIAQAVGKSMKSLSQFHQVIAITHLPQIAGFADCHFAVEKSETKQRTSSTIRKLDETERIREVARLLSGEEVTESSLNGAREMMGKR
ncbi:MAG: DNA repair protein RecN [Ignavibacteriae bacterium]|nr:MAG: DNA repair protein RecN [Ignavibacteriota bacterium]